MLMSYENDRRTLANRAHEVLGEEAGETLMEHLPYGGYAHVATKDDLETQGLLLRSDIREASEVLRREIADSARRQTIAMVGIMAALMSAQTALIVAFVR
jgi:hypothetical protein